MKTEILTVSHEEAALLLREKLGSHRSWNSFLADIRRGKTHSLELILLPCACQKGSTGALLPRYAVTAIEAFSEAVLALPGSLYSPHPISPTLLKIDEEKHWKQNRFDKRGSSIKAKKIIH